MTISYVDKNSGEPKALTLGQDTPYIPSVAAYDQATGRYEFGRAAKSRTGKKDVTLLKGFKMLLPEKDPARLAERGFTGKHTPESVTRRFIGYYLGKALTDLDETAVDELVICAPEIWNDAAGTLDGRLALGRICQQMGCVKHVRIVSEPAAAAAFFAYNYRKTGHTGYNGCILLVDYGGGTLDITLTRVKDVPEGDKDVMEVQILDRCGAGENEDGEIGKAGIVYMETVMAEAIAKAGMPVKKDGRFLKAADELEREIVNRTDAILQEFDVYLDYPEQMAEHMFTYIEYNGKDIPVSYGSMAAVYARVIYPVLDANLKKMKKLMDKRGLDYMNGESDAFKIALVGGFGNFYLVRRQIEEAFRIRVKDKRTEGIIRKREDREQAVSLGAALLAEGSVRLRDTAAYSIGVWNYDPITGDPCLNYAIRYKQDLEYDRVYFARSPADDAPTVIMAPKGGFRNFLINFGDDDRTARPALAKEAFAKKLSHVITNTYHTAVIGFSISQSGVISLHIHDYDLLAGHIDEADHVIELTRYADLFEITDVKRVL